VNEILAHIRAHGGPARVPLFGYEEDFSEYLPRGHYAGSADLRNYFVAMTWFGRMSFLLKGGEQAGPGARPALVSLPEARRQTLAAALLAAALDRARLADGRKARDVWERLYTVTSFFAGLASDLGPEQYRAALTRVCGPSRDLAALANERHFAALQRELALLSSPGGTGRTAGLDPAHGPDGLVAALPARAGFRLFGQRFLPDADILNRLVTPAVGPAT